MTAKAARQARAARGPEVCRNDTERAEAAAALAAYRAWIARRGAKR